MSDHSTATSAATTATVDPDVAGFNALSEDDCRGRLTSCLNVRRWVEHVAAGRPYADWAVLVAAAEQAAATLEPEEVDSALAGHPRIGEKATDAKHDAKLSSREQAGVDASDSAVVDALAAGNRAYERRFDRVFLIRAAGRSSSEILAELQRRLDNDDEAERAETVTQLREIAILRLKEML
ncbi:MAG: 2-oxo-4-hydroxy-4-carboxy-5-ureidoimidazoline decarboxylase [Terracoccus sp.]